MALQNVSFTPVQPTTVTITSANPGVVTWNNHGLLPNQAIIFNTTGTLPLNLSPLTVYYVSATGFAVSSFQVSTTQGGSSINTTGGAPSGTHTATAVIMGLHSGQDVMANSSGMAIASDQAWPSIAPTALPTTLVSSWQAKASAGGLVSVFCNVTTLSGWLFIVDATSVSNGVIVPLWSVPIDSNNVHGHYEHSWGLSPLKFSTGCVACFSTTGPTASNVTLTLSATAFFGGQVQ